MNHEQAKHLKAALLEIVRLKLYATSEQLSKLNFEQFDASHLDRSIYGQIFGWAYSYEATILAKKCVSNLGINENIQDRNTTPLEWFLHASQPYEWKAVIDYLQGRRENLTFPLPAEN